ncbi:hypothetical protein Tco_0999659 [Tanacetum coccineum]
MRGDGSMKDETILHMLCILNGLLYIVMEGLEIVDFLLNTFFFEKVKALGAKGVVKGSRLGVVWMMLCGGIERARVVSRVLSFEEMLMILVLGVFFGGFCVEELALETIVFLLGRDDMRDLIFEGDSEKPESDGVRVGRRGLLPLVLRQKTLLFERGVIT